MKKKAINLWLLPDEYAWLKDYAKDRGLTMTHVLREMINEKKQADERSRRPIQF